MLAFQIRNSPQKQDQIAGGNGVIQHGKQRVRQADHPGDRGQQRQAHNHGGGQTEPASFVLLRFGQLGHHQRQKNDVINTQYDLKNG